MESDSLAIGFKLSASKSLARMASSMTVRTPSQVSTAVGISSFLFKINPFNTENFNF